MCFIISLCSLLFACYVHHSPSFTMESCSRHTRLLDILENPEVRLNRIRAPIPIVSICGKSIWIYLPKSFSTERAFIHEDLYAIVRQNGCVVDAACFCRAHKWVEHCGTDAAGCMCSLPFSKADVEPISVLARSLSIYLRFATLFFVVGSKRRFRRNSNRR
jgi:hypothetical protein